LPSFTQALDRDPDSSIEPAFSISALRIQDFGSRANLLAFVYLIPFILQNFGAA
jgi:hypothetical protein